MNDFAADNYESYHINNELSDWQLFEFLPADTANVHSENQSTNTDKLADLDVFFSNFAAEVSKLNLLEKDTNCVLKLCTSLVKNVNELNKLLIIDSQNLPPLQVNLK